jgi:DNA-binding NtrC family response regulator
MTARILVVDDETGIRSGVSEILLLEGYAVDAADCGRAAQELLSQAAYDVVLIDYRLPDIDGLTLLQSIRQKCPEVMTCMITAYANIETAIFATRQGIDFFSPSRFLRMICSARSIACSATRSCATKQSVCAPPTPRVSVNWHPKRARRTRWWPACAMACWW